MHLSDKELRHELAAAPSSEVFQPLLDYYLRWVYCAAYRQTGNDTGAATEVTRAVFLALAWSAGRLPNKVDLVGWLFEATRLAARGLRTDRKRRNPATVQWDLESSSAVCDEHWARLSPLFESCLNRITAKNRNPMLLRFVLNWSIGRTAEALHIQQMQSEKRARAGLGELIQCLAKKKFRIDEELLLEALRTGPTALPLPPELACDILSAAQDCFRRRPKLALARRTLRAMAWQLWQRRLKVLCVTAGVLMAVWAALSRSAH